MRRLRKEKKKSKADSEKKQRRKAKAYLASNRGSLPSCRYSSSTTQRQRRSEQQQKRLGENERAPAIEEAEVTETALPSSTSTSSTSEPTLLLLLSFRFSVGCYSVPDDESVQTRERDAISSISHYFHKEYEKREAVARCKKKENKSQFRLVSNEKREV